MSYTPTDDELHAYLKTQIAVGYYDADDIVEGAAYMFRIDEAAVQPLVDALTTELEAELDRWPDVTDCDRLDAAFVALDQSGIRARQHFACCNSCGHYEMHEDIHLARALGAKIDGYVFYHRQDAENVVTTGELRLRYATLNGERDAEIALAERVIGALREQGLTPSWDGDPGTTITLRGFCWQRRGWPDEPDETEAWTAAKTLDEWTTQITAMTASHLIGVLGSRFLKELVNVGLVDIALAWAHVKPPSAWILSHVGGLLRSNELWREVFASVPYGRCGDLVEVLLEAPLEDPTLRRIARTRVLDSRPDIYGAAAVAWYLARSKEDDEALLQRVQLKLAQSEDSLESRPRLAIEAALWVIYARRGETDSARAMRERVIPGIERYHGGHVSPDFAASAARVAAGIVGDDALLERPSEPPMKASIEEAEAHLAKVKEEYNEGLSTSYEVEAAERGLVWVKIKLGDRDAKLRELAAFAKKHRDDVIDIGGDVRAQIERAQGGEELRAFSVDESWLAEPARRKLDRHIATWTQAKDRTAPSSARQAGKKILEAAAAFAEHGDVARARDLVELVLDTEERLAVDEKAAVVALLALGELDRAVELAESRALGFEALTPLAVALAQAGRKGEALKWIRLAFRYVYNRGRITTLAPAVLAVADAPSAAAAATAMLDAWARADASLDALIPPSSPAGR